jgi:hypothetical protein
MAQDIPGEKLRVIKSYNTHQHSLFKRVADLHNGRVVDLVWKKGLCPASVSTSYLIHKNLTLYKFVAESFQITSSRLIMWGLWNQFRSQKSTTISDLRQHVVSFKALMSRWIEMYACVCIRQFSSAT